ncbi:MAG TPA: serine hydrolase domain-containing protein [Gaiellales bacterium]|nr:serine hydrolase domain-containing protein [Gaiellales bacterium]
MAELLSPDAADRLRAHAEARIGAGDMMGVAAAVTDVAGAETVITAGCADAAGSPLRPGHLLQIGSISKSFAAICALQLEAEGALSLDDELVRHLPWFRVGKGRGPITLRHLLMHRSGLPTGSDPAPSSAALIGEMARAETEWAPGERFWYSNVGYDAVGMALEAVTGEGFPQIIRRRVLDPLGMAASAAHIAPQHRERLADGFEPLHPDRPRHPGSPLATAPFTVSEGASGSIVSTASDMARYVRHLLGSGPVGFDRMIAGLPDDEGSPYGLGVWITERKGHRIVGHSGGMVGYVAQMLCDMDAGLGVISLANGPGGARTVAEYALDLARAEHEGADLPDPPADGAADLTPYHGTYGPVTVTAAGIEANGRSGGLAEHATDEYTTDHPDLTESFVRFGRGGDGRVDHVILADSWYPADSSTGPREFPHPPEWEGYPGVYRSHNPWLAAVRVTLSRGSLGAEPSGHGHKPLTPHPSGGFAWTAGEVRLPERMHFSEVVDGRAQRLEWGGCLLCRAARH